MAGPVGWVAIYGAVTATCALAVSAANFWRDRGRVFIDVAFDRFRHNGGLLQRDPHIKVTVFNTGRRPVLITMLVVHFRGNSFVCEDVEATRLEESGPPLVGYLPYTPELEAIIRERWWQAEALAFGGGGRMYRSRLPRFKPSSSTVERPGRWTRSRHKLRSQALRLRGKVKRLLKG